MKLVLALCLIISLAAFGAIFIHVSVSATGGDSFTGFLRLGGEEDSLVVVGGESGSSFTIGYVPSTPSIPPTPSGSPLIPTPILAIGGFAFAALGVAIFSMAGFVVFSMVKAGQEGTIQIGWEAVAILVGMFLVTYVIFASVTI